MPSSAHAVAAATPASIADLEQLSQRYAQVCAEGLHINMTRGVPAAEQLALAETFLALPGAGDWRARDGSDTRNYGGLQGLPEARELLAGPLLGLPAEQVAIGENSSLALMHEALGYAMLHGVGSGQQPWTKAAQIKFICPVPGYDRHFSLCEAFGIEMLPVPLLADGPDMDAVEALVAGDAAIKGMWCVPKYSNPSGVIYSDQVVARLARMPTAAADFRLFWDNAYAVHHLTAARPANQDISGLAAAAGHAERVLMFASTSKVLFPGAGLALFGGSPATLAWWLGHRALRTIGPDKLNQLRHVRFFEGCGGLEQHMQAQQEVLAAKFACVDQVFREQFASAPDGAPAARWSQPQGGYFVSLQVREGCARRTVELAREAGVALTPAGAPFPYGLDPHDSLIRISPTCVGLADLAKACAVVALCAQLAAAQLQAQ
ncbi:aminotransferase class I/II-fold pyridoxal phosphate-dependent enzyme [Pseudomonas sp. HR96]|uniref:aminotransferase class I/II-fold pyridoxal phosphate-dependent enzyme n=1 Tax=Pseudomonas sp. HR96 TaxID=1027966 RepID=UPI002A74C61B|nr:aminotransferase class I/II-fold pyridoxal phosphate-dependent enzyme [Pseudomonas sp. HR96]WPO97753.1 aminotransferase class I/II-fold pyridoxal phosphate-dependent enzyme [Pseudomonas sp. HR96]